jgi:hypothetical protein
VIAHTERAHSLLSASKAEQWINCPPSARLQEGIPDRRSEYSDEGTLAHELAEVMLRRRLLPCDSKERKRLEKRLDELRSSPMFSAEMERLIQEYMEFVEERFMAAKARSSDAVILLEEKLDYSEWTAPGQTGTGDVVLIADGTLELIDLKYGKGVPVSAAGNPQIRLYALGAWSGYGFLYDIREIRMTIYQPRLDSISTDTMTVEELLDWAENVVKPAARLAYEGKGDFKPGDHCRWCKVKATCRARADENMKALQYEFQDPALLTLDEIGQILHIAQKLHEWAKDVEEYAFDRAVAGERVPGWKLVEGRSNRIITNPDAAKERLAGAGLEQDVYLKPRELFGIGELEKRIGKKQLAEILGELIHKPPGKPVLVPETDPRPELNSIEHEFANENWEE